MPVVKRTDILRGPGLVRLGGYAIDDKDAIACVMESTTDDITTSLRGKVDTIATDTTIKTTLTPYGGITNELLALFFALQPKNIGTSIFGETDTPMTVHSRLGTRLELVNSAITKAPEINLTPIRTAFGQLEITSLLALDKYGGDAAAFYNLSSVAFPSGHVQPKPMVGAAYFGAWGSFILDDTEDGWIITPEFTLTPVKTSNRGTVDLTLSDIKVTAKCVPVDKTEADIIAALPINKKLGSSLATGDDLVIAGPGGLAVTLKNASLVSGPMNWGSDALRFGELVWEANADSNDILYTVELAS